MNNIVNCEDKRFCLNRDKMPIHPYRYEKKINSKKSYLIDGEGFIWILVDMIINEKDDWGLCYFDGVLRECMYYIIKYDRLESYHHIKQFIRRP